MKLVKIHYHASAFLENPSPIHAGSKDDPSVTKTSFSHYKVPRSGDYETSLENYLNSVKATVIDKATRVSSSKMIGHMVIAVAQTFRAWKIWFLFSNFFFCTPDRCLALLPPSIGSSVNRHEPERCEARDGIYHDLLGTGNCRHDAS